MQDAIFEGRECRQQQRRREHAATLIQRAWRSFSLRRRHKQMIHTVREVWELHTIANPGVPCCSR